MRFHVPGLPHTVTNHTYIHCAFTQKVFKLCKMLHSLGHEVYHYGCEGSNPICTEDVQVITDEYREKFYPDEWHDKHWDYNIQDDCHKEFYKNTIREIKKRQGDKDFFLASWGWGHKPIADALGNSVITVEPGIGYADTFSRYRVFESYTWMSHVYGRGIINEKGQRVTLQNGSYFDAVIPNYFDPDDFEFNPDEKEDYFLYLGRIIKRKGIDIVLEIAKTAGIHVKVAGQGNLKIPERSGNEIIEHVGFADAEKRKSLFSKARGLLMPTIYLEPFGGVSIESMISGTPVICTDWGVFPETILHGVVGYRCRTLDQFVWAVRNIDNISPQVCRDYALSNFSLERVSAMYQEYFDSLITIWGKGWYAINPKRKEMSWLEKYYPNSVPNSITPKRVRPAIVAESVCSIEKEMDYALDLTWYEKEKKPGISFIVRAKNEQDTIGLALDSLKQLKIPYEVNLVLNQCDDGTEHEANFRRVNKQNINIYRYPFQLGKTGLENACTPVTSVHSTIWMLNWILMRGTYEYTFRWDSDFIMTGALAKELEEFLGQNRYNLANISAVFSDTDKSNTEPYLWSNNLVPRYARYSLWHIARFGDNVVNATTLQGKIIHDSPLKETKEYWTAEPWWEVDTREETQKLRSSAKEKYERLKKLIGNDCTTHGRASCPESEELARRLQKAIGIDTEEIPALKEYALSLR